MLTRRLGEPDPHHLIMHYTTPAATLTGERRRVAYHGDHRGRRTGGAEATPDFAQPVEHPQHPLVQTDVAPTQADRLATPQPQQRDQVETLVLPIPLAAP